MSIFSFPLKIFTSLWRRRARVEDDFLPVYQAIMTQSRQAYLYGEEAAPDSFDGRFDVLIMHICLVLRRLNKEKTAQTNIAGQALFDLLFRDMERVLRETGTGDLSVGKKIGKMAQAFYGRAAAYDKALAAGDNAALADVLQRNFYPQNDAPTCLALADYMRRMEAYLSALSLDVILSRDIFARFSQGLK